jgi:hypothetical protein
MNITETISNTFKRKKRNQSNGTIIKKGNSSIEQTLENIENKQLLDLTLKAVKNRNNGINMSHKQMCEKYGYTVEEIEELAEIVEIE